MINVKNLIFRLLTIVLLFNLATGNALAVARNGSGPRISFHAPTAKPSQNPAGPLLNPSNPAGPNDGRNHANRVLANPSSSRFSDLFSWISTAYQMGHYNTWHPHGGNNCHAGSVSGEIADSQNFSPVSHSGCHVNMSTTTEHDSYIPYLYRDDLKVLINAFCSGMSAEAQFNGGCKALAEMTIISMLGYIYQGLPIPGNMHGCDVPDFELC